MAIAQLDEVERYTNEAIVLRFMETWDLPRADADDLFAQMLKWLWLTATVTAWPEPVTLAISQSTKLVDEMWHTFILFSKDYSAFCDRYFGAYVHHIPTPQAEYEKQIREYERDNEAYMDGLRELFSRQYEIVYDQLGEETLVKWYSEYADRYTDEYMRQIWRWSFSPYDTRVRESVRLASPVTAPAAVGDQGGGHG
jgi:hypothetical protein